MKTFFFAVMLVSCNFCVFAQSSAARKASSKSEKKKPIPRLSSSPKTFQPKMFSPADTATVPEANVNPAKMQLPKTIGPSASKLNNSVMKTPMYNSMETGTNAPGDVNTGLQSDNSLNHYPVNNNFNRLRASSDSSRHAH